MQDLYQNEDERLCTVQIFVTILNFSLPFMANIVVGMHAEKNEKLVK